MADRRTETSTELEAFSQLVEAVYAGPLEDSPWSGFLEALQVKMAATAVTLIIQPPDSDGPGYIMNAGVNAASRWGASYQERFFASDPFIHLPEGKPVTISEFVPREQLLLSSW